MSLKLYTQQQVAEICKPVFEEFSIDSNFMANRMCGLTTCANLINNLYQTTLLPLEKLPTILNILLKYNNQAHLSKGKLTDPGTFKSFDSEGNMFHNAAICIFEAANLAWLPIFNPDNPQNVYSLLDEKTNLFLSINNQRFNGSRHLVCLTRDYLIDPESSQPQSGYQEFLNKYWVNWSSVLVSTSKINIDKIPSDIKIKPVFETEKDILNNPPGTIPWPAFIPSIIVKEISNVLR
jgi:hypothetical protein